MFVKRLFSMPRMGRLLVSLLLCAGFLMPILMTLNAESAILPAILLSGGLLVVFTVLGAMKKGRLWLAVFVVALVLAQFLLPNRGLIGDGLEALKALGLYITGVQTATPLFASEIGFALAAALAIITYAFTSDSVGFIPMAVLTVGMLFGVWSLGQPQYLLYAMPALIALLTLISQSSHKNINLFKVLPVSFGIVLIAMLLMPTGQFAIDSLYESTMDLKQKISDYLFFTDARNVFTLGAYGYYPEGNSKLGGPVEIQEEVPILLVKTDERTLLRAVSKDDYTGRSWRDTSSSRRYLYINPRWRAVREKAFSENLPDVSVRNASPLLNQKAVSVEVQNTLTSTVFTPSMLRSFNAQGDMVAYFNDAGELFITRDMQRGDKYTVYAPILEGGDASLGALIAAAPKNDSQYESILRQYTTLPSHMESKVFEDLNNIVAQSETPYEKACAILRHLKRYYRYTLTPVTPPENQDFVTYFLYVGKEGYCTYFASAMTVLCRMAGLPARYVEGFLAQPDGGGFAYVTAKDAHAWTEVYFEGFGWVPFDATPEKQNDTPDSPSTPPPEQNPPPEEEEIPPEDEPEDEPDSEPDSEDEPESRSFPWLWLIALLALLLAALVVYTVYRSPTHTAARCKTALDQIFVYGCACYALCAARGQKLHGGEIPLHFAARMDGQKLFPVQLTPLWRTMSDSAYRGAFLTEDDAALAANTYRRFISSRSLPEKLKLWLNAAWRRRFYQQMEIILPHEEPRPLFARLNIPKPQGNEAPRKAPQKAASKGRKKFAEKPANQKEGSK